MVIPQVTILMPNYNYGCFLRQAIESVLSQSFPDFEFLIIDDASSDNSPEIIREYMDQDRRIKGIFHKENVGVIASYNEGTALAQGKYIHFMAADDYRYPGFLQKCMDTLLERPELGMCFSQYDLGDGEKRQLEKCGYESDGSTLFFSPVDMADAFLNHNLKIFAVAAIMKTSLVAQHGYFDPKLYYYSDWYLLNEIAFFHPSAFILEPLSYFRIHETNFSNVYRRRKETKRAALRHMLVKLNAPQNRHYKEQVRKSALLTFIFQEHFWKMLFNPKYISFWPYINQKFPVKERLKRSIKKKLGFKVAPL
jgi:glycosyltransferase involved in cell wall biosynthesis